jgi:C-terminal processing protease CtpA/Prc
MIQDEYYHFSEKTKEEVENGFITSLVSSLGDKHSTYFPPKDAEEFSDTLRGDFEGIGAVIDENPK